MLNKSGESGHAHLILDLKGNTFSFFPLSVLLVMGLSHMVLIILRYAPSIPTLPRVFILNKC